MEPELENDWMNAPLLSPLLSPTVGDSAGNVAGGGFTFASAGGALGATSPTVTNVAWQGISSSATYCSYADAVGSNA